MQKLPALPGCGHNVRIFQSFAGETPAFPKVLQLPQLLIRETPISYYPFHSAFVPALLDAAPSLGSLGLPLALDDLALLPNGLVLLCGATGSGKSATLAAIAQEALRRCSILLVTLEDPIEYTCRVFPLARAPSLDRARRGGLRFRFTRRVVRGSRRVA